MSSGYFVSWALGHRALLLSQLHLRGARRSGRRAAEGQQGEDSEDPAERWCACKVRWVAALGVGVVGRASGLCESQQPIATSSIQHPAPQHVLQHPAGLHLRFRFRYL